MAITVVNCRSCVGKVPELEALKESTETHIIIGSESWLKPEISSAEVFAKELTVFRKDRLNKIGGGVFVAVKSSISCSEVDVDSSCELLWVEVVPENRKKLIIGSFYRPPDSDDTTAERFKETNYTNVPDSYDNSRLPYTTALS